MIRRVAFSLLPLVGILLCAASFAAAADDFLKLVPDSAWGFVAINQPTEMDAKIQALSHEMQLPSPGLLSRVKQLSGVQEGFDEKGTVVMMVLPSEKDSDIPVTLILLVPVTDYDKFLAQLQPESTTDEVTKCKFFGDDSWARKVGNYAALCGPPFRGALEKLTPASEVPAALKPWGEWISTHDAAGIVFQPGIKELTSKGQNWLNTAKMMLGAAGDQGKQALAAFEMYGKLLEAADKEVSAFGIGLALDKQNVLRLTSRTALVPEGNWAKVVGKSPAPKENPLVDLPNDPYMFAGGIALSEEMVNNMKKISFDLMKSMPDLYGLSSEQIDKMISQLEPQFKGAHAMSIILGTGKSDEPLYANMLNITKVDNTATYMANMEKYFQQYNELIKNSKSPLLKPLEVEKSEVAGVQGFQVKMELPKPQGPMPPQYDKMMQAMLGSAGSMVFWIAPADEHTLVTGYVNKKLMERTMADIKQKKPGLVENAELKKTVALLPADAPAVAYLSPQGTIDFVKRMIAAILPPGMQDRVTIPEFPATPPLGLAIQSAPNEIDTTLVVPAEFLKALGQYINHVRGMSREDVTMNR